MKPKDGRGFGGHLSTKVPSATRPTFRRDQLVLPEILTDRQKDEVINIIQTLMLDTGAEARLRSATKANVSEFGANVNAMFDRVRADFQPLLYEAVNSFALQAEENNLELLTEFSLLVVRKHDAESRLSALRIHQTALQDAVADVQQKALKSLTEVLEAKLETVKARTNSIAGSHGEGATIEDLRRAMAQVKGLAKGIAGMAPFKNGDIRKNILEILDKYVAD